MVAKNIRSQEERDLQKLKVVIDITRKSSAPSAAPPSALESPVAEPAPVAETEVPVAGTEVPVAGTEVPVAETEVPVEAPEIAVPPVSEEATNTTDIFITENITVADVVDKVTTAVDEAVGTADSSFGSGSSSGTFPVADIYVTFTAFPTLSPIDQADVIDTVAADAEAAASGTPNAAFSPYGADPMSTMLLCFVCLVVLTLR